MRNLDSTARRSPLPFLYGLSGTQYAAILDTYPMSSWGAARWSQSDHSESRTITTCYRGLACERQCSTKAALASTGNILSRNQISTLSKDTFEKQV